MWWIFDKTKIYDIEIVDQPGSHGSFTSLTHSILETSANKFAAVKVWSGPLFKTYLHVFFADRVLVAVQVGKG